VDFLDQGGELVYVDLTAKLLRGYLKRQIPILAGLSATHLYRASRVYGPHDEDDDVRGHPSGHFVVLCGYNALWRTVRVADPYAPHPMGGDGLIYDVSIDRVVNAVLLGVLTHDANLLILHPPRGAARAP
jgi:hypothetical protein